MLAYNRQGSGNTLVLLHGFCENSTCFNEQVLLLKDHLDVLTVDLPGVGGSPVIAGLSMEKIADAVHGVLLHEGISSCVMIGHSMGGYATLAFAKKFPGLLKGLGLLHSTAAADTPERLEKRRQAITVIREKGAAFYVRNFIPPLFAPDFNNNEVKEHCIREGLRTSAEGLTENISAMMNRPDSFALLEQTSLPVFFGVGKQDSLIPSAAMLEQAASCKKVFVKILQRSGHMGMLEEPAACAEAIRTFVQYCASVR